MRSRQGIDNLAAHIGIIRQYGLPCVVSINNFPTDTDAEVELIHELARRRRRRDGGREPWLRRGRRRARSSSRRPSSPRANVPARSTSSRRTARRSREQIEAIATHVCTAPTASTTCRRPRPDLARMDRSRLPARSRSCMAKTHLSLSHEPTG